MIQPIIIGGGQERGLRSGTENIPGIVGMAKAAEIAMERLNDDSLRLSKFRDDLIEAIKKTIPKSHLNGDRNKRLPNNAHFRFDYIEGESLLLKLKDKGIAISTGSACSSTTLEPSHTLISMGLLHEEAHGSLEVTLGRFTPKEEVDKLVAVLPKVVEELRKLSTLTKDDDLKKKLKQSDVKILLESELLEISGFSTVEKVRIHDLNEDEEYDLFVDAVIIPK